MEAREEQKKEYFIGDKVFIIAEAGSNWKCGNVSEDLGKAKELIDVAAEVKADAVKFQTYSSPESVYVANAGMSDYLANLGILTDIKEVIRDIVMPREMIPELAKHCEEKRIMFMSTPFSLEDAKAIDPFVQIHKIGSYEISHPHLLKFAAQSKKPLILSTGAASLEDIKWAVDFFQQNGGEKIALMQCTGQYPAPFSILNLRAIPQLKKDFHLPIGFSDHSDPEDPLTAPMAAVALGAVIIERHFTLDRKSPGPDHSFALLPADLKLMVKAIRKVEQCLGNGQKFVQEAEQELNLFAQRALQAIKDIKAGEIFKEDFNFAVLRPGKQKKGTHPKFLPEIEGKTAKRDIPLGDGIQLGDF